MDKYIVILFASHLIADFLLQPNHLIQKKERARYLFVHGAIHALLTYILLQNWLQWQVPVLVFFCIP